VNTNSAGQKHHRWHPRLRRRPKARLFRNHSLSIVAGTILVTWIIAYCFSDPNKHLGAFFGNAIADWTGTIVMILGTKFLYERGSAESRDCPEHHFTHRMFDFLEEHSLSIFLIVTGIGWVLAYIHMDVNGRWGQVVGNIVSEWTQTFGIVILTKRLIEVGSKESKE
jgi:succinate dehydrogenase hydrophobic anchor subunit